MKYVVLGVLAANKQAPLARSQTDMDTAFISAKCACVQSRATRSQTNTELAWMYDTFAYAALLYYTWSSYTTPIHTCCVPSRMHRSSSIGGSRSNVEHPYTYEYEHTHIIPCNRASSVPVTKACMCHPSYTHKYIRAY